VTTDREVLSAFVLHHEAEVATLQAEIADLRDALSELLLDTQHEQHICGDDTCPVVRARVLLKEGTTNA
jgi:hypothetical protein